MNILIIGATGFIGRELVKELEQSGHKVVAVSRNALKAKNILGEQVEIAEWNGTSPAELAKLISGMDAVINLAGESIASGRWTARRKQLITASRIQTGRLLEEAVRLSPVAPSVLIQGSAIGYYGTPVEFPADENQPAGTGFIAELTMEWEASVESAGKMIPRIIYLRTGLVLGKNGGLLEKMLLPFRFYCGTVIGSGKQWMSWIHINDQVRAIRFLLENGQSAGAYNLTAPKPVMMKDFISVISKTIKKPAWLKVPGFFLKFALGEMADETILSSQNIFPGKLLKEGFTFNYSALSSALENLLIEKK